MATIRKSVKLGRAWMARSARVINRFLLAVLFIASLFSGHSLHFSPVKASTSSDIVTAGSSSHSMAMNNGSHSMAMNNDCGTDNASQHACDHNKIPDCAFGFCCYSIPESFKHQETCKTSISNLFIPEPYSLTACQDPPPPKIS